MTVRDVAAYLSVAEKRIYRLAQKGKLPGFKVAGAWRFQRTYLDQWTEKQEEDRGLSGEAGEERVKETVQERLERATQEARAAYYRLVLLVGEPKSGKTRELKATAEQMQCPVVNLNLTLSQRLLELTRKRRALRVRTILAEELGGLEADTVMLDNIEVLFDPELAQDPLRLLQGLARNRTITSTWPGTFNGTYLTYAEPGHPEWRRYTRPEAAVVPIDESRALPK